MLSNMSTEAAGSQVDDGSMQSLLSMIEKTECYARNESSQYPMTNLFTGDTRLGCKSDADEQLIIHIGFMETVKVRLYAFTLQIIDHD